MKFFVTGVNGQLGHDVMNELSKRGHQAIGSDISDTYAGVADDSAVIAMPYIGLDITDKNSVLRVIKEIKPDAVIHCAAWTAVDMAEDDDKADAVRNVNAGGTQNIADACKSIDCKMLYLPTDYVFDGQGTEPWKPDHATNEGGYISWYDFCVEFYKQYGLNTRVTPVATEEYGLSKAARPANSRLDKRKLVEAGFKPLPTWQDAVSRYLKEAQL